MTENLGALAARSAAEAQIYMDLHPCECGTPRSRGAQDLRDDGNGGLTSVYAGTCPGCGWRQWSFAFTLPAFQPPVGRIGGREPSKIIDPGEWIYLSDLHAGFPASRRPGPEDCARLSRAATAVEEAAKFILPGLEPRPRRGVHLPLRARHVQRRPGAFPEDGAARARPAVQDRGCVADGHRSWEMTG